jgi:ClpP class serine protease
MKRDLPRLMDAWLNAPLCCTARYAEIAAAVFSGRMNIESVRSEYGRMGRAELEGVAKGAKIKADAKRAERMRGSIIEETDDIAVIQVYGALTRCWGIGPYSGATGYDGILMQLEDALVDDDIKGIWLDVDSGGGTVNGLFDLVDQVYKFREGNGGPKPIWGMAADYAHSAAYALLSACDQCFVGPTGGVGSVGTITMHTSYKRQDELAGIDVTVLRDPPLKATATEFEDLDEKTREHIMAQLGAITGIFQDRVARNRGIAKSAVAGTQGLDYMGSDAKAIGFITDVLPESQVWENFRQLIASR